MPLITATPGRFWEAMVTTNSGSAKLIAACSENAGIVNTGKVSPGCTADHWILPCASAMAIPTANVAITA